MLIVFQIQLNAYMTFKIFAKLITFTIGPTHQIEMPCNCMIHSSLKPQRTAMEMSNRLNKQ